MDTIVGGKACDETTLPQSTISRYACRIVISRSPPYTARIYAAGFDGSKNIFLGVGRGLVTEPMLRSSLSQEKSMKWKTTRNEMDGVTTNGVLIMHIDGEQFNGNVKPTKWKEVSVGGSVFDLGDGRFKSNYQSAVNR